ncbi:MAG: HAMP domain-containing histidine kinase [Clostridia bacterium]|nr:HAMP domain-containing histidine kinase [Clostridia bacterium]
MNNNSVKYSLWIKALCLILSILTFGLFAFNALYAVRPLEFLDPYDAFDGGKSFYDSDKAKEVFSYAISDMQTLTGESVSEKEKELQKIKEAEIEENLQRYKDNKIQIIREELTYVANQNESYDPDNANGLTEGYIDSIPDTPENEREYQIDPYDHASVRVARKVLNYAEGEEFLKYDNLVRSEAFDQSFECRFKKLNNYGFYFDYNISVSGAKKQIEEYADNAYYDTFDNYKERFSEAKERVSKLENIKYYIKTKDNVITNMTETEQNSGITKGHQFYCIKNKDVVKAAGVQNYLSGSNATRYIKEDFKNCTEFKAYIVNEDQLTGNDIITDYCDRFQSINYSIKPYMIKAAVFFVISIAALVILLLLAGHKKGFDGITPAFIDKLPGDIHLALSTASIVAGCCILIDFVEEFIFFNDYYIQTTERGRTILHEDGLVIVALGLTVMWAVLVEWITSVVRIAKSDRKYFRNFFVVRVVIFIWNIIKKLVKGFVNIIRKHDLKYKPKYFTRKTLILFGILAILDPILVAASIIVTDEFSVGLIVAIFTAIAGIIALVFLTKYVKNLDKVVDASEKRESVDFGNENVHESLKILNDSLKISNDELATAVEKAVKNERTKTELITNVSHDLKTPLTSIISYVDLLKNSEADSEEAKKYIGIIDEKSANLKVLIENLIEASKVSAGNIKLNPVRFNLKELVIQSIVEYSPEFESRNLDLRFNENCDNVIVFADGQQTYRVIENLLSNAKKYSAPNTRVYVSLKEADGFGVFEIKNTSKEPLDISPEELTERFVRGDASRGEEEGNGLGLSIAKELCTLQNGKLELNIDGDLFKATVYLPM